MRDPLGYDAKYEETVVSYHLIKTNLHNLIDGEDNDTFSNMNEAQT